jgi:hypothetical protein
MRANLIPSQMARLFHQKRTILAAATLLRPAGQPIVLNSALPTLSLREQMRIKDCAHGNLPDPREYTTSHHQSPTPISGHPDHADFSSSTTPTPPASKLRTDTYHTSTHRIHAPHSVSVPVLTKLTALLSFPAKTCKTRLTFAKIMLAPPHTCRKLVCEHFPPFAKRISEIRSAVAALFNL